MDNNVKLKHSEIIRVNFFDADPLGIVWHGNYIKYFEIAREAFGDKFGLTYLHAKRHGYATPIVSTETAHKLPLKYGDKATVEVTFENYDAAKLVFHYKIYNDQYTLVCTGKTIQVFTDYNSGELSIINPPFFKDWKQKNGLAID